MAQNFSCPSCTAPLDFDGEGTTVRCPYCDTNVIVPPSLRRAGMSERARSVQITIGGADGSDLLTIHTDAESADPNAVLAEVQQLAQAGRTAEAVRLHRETFGGAPAATQAAVQKMAQNAPLPPARAPFGRVRRSGPAPAPAPRQRGYAGCIGIVALLIILGSAGAATWLSVAPSTSVVESVTTIGQTITQSFESVAPQGIAEPGGWAVEVNRFGSEGIGQGMFTDARAIAVSSGRIYVGDYDTSRVQVFSEQGEFETQWFFPKDSYVDQFAVSRDGVLHAAVRSQMHTYAAGNGRLLNAQEADENSWLQAAGVHEGSGAPWFQDSVVMAPDGGLVTVIGGDIVRFDQGGVPVLVIPDAVESVSDLSETTTKLAIDGLGNLFALGVSQDVVYKFAADGRYLSRFGAQAVGGDSDGQGVLRAASSIVVDGQGRVFVGDIDGVEVFDSEGRSIALIDVPGYPLGLAIGDSGNLFVANRDKVLEFRIVGG